MTADEASPDPAPEDDEPVVIPLRYGLVAVYVMREKPPPPPPVCREPDPVPLPWPPEDWEPPSWCR